MRRGVTILEVLLAATMLALLMGVAFSLLSSGARQQAFVAGHADLAANTRRAVRRLTRDLRSARTILRLSRRADAGLDTLVVELPDPDDSRFFERVQYDYKATEGELLRNGEAILRDGVRDLQVFAFDDAGQLLNDQEALLRMAYLRLRFELGQLDDPPARRRKLDLTITPRVPASKARADRLLIERGLDRFQRPEDIRGLPLTTP